MEEYNDGVNHSHQAIVLELPKKLTPDIDLKSDLNNYEVEIIEFDSLARKIDLLISTWSEINNQKLIDEVEQIRINKTFTSKLLKLIKEI